MSKRVLVIRVSLACAAESVRAIIDSGFVLATCVRERDAAQHLIYTFTHAHVCSLEDEEELEDVHNALSRTHLRRALNRPR